ncbi:MAG: universal stress protein [Dehalococcoidia bacterium]
MFSKILVPLDCSDLAEQVLPLVSTLASGLNTPIQLISVIQQLPDEFSGSTGVDQREVMEDWRRQASEYLQDVSRRLEQDDLKVSYAVVQGDIASSIVGEAEQHDDAVIAMSTHGWEGTARWNLGSVAHKILQAAANPVLVVRGQGQRPKECKRKLDNIIVPLDGSDLSELALPYALSLAKAHSAQLVLMRVTASVWDYYSHMDHTVLHSGDLSKVARDRAAEYLDRVGEQLQRQGISQMEQRIETGEPAGTIIDLAESIPNSLITMVTHGLGSSGRRRWAMGSVAQRVAGSCASPVLVVPPQGH